MIILMFTLITTSDGSLLRDDRVIYFSYKRFVQDIVQGNRCFICGANPELTIFNDEHVIPDWILRRYGLHNRVITLPNQTQFKYGHFKMPAVKGATASWASRLRNLSARCSIRDMTALLTN